MLKLVYHVWITHRNLRNTDIGRRKIVGTDPRGGGGGYVLRVVPYLHSLPDILHFTAHTSARLLRYPVYNNNKKMYRSPLCRNFSSVRAASGGQRRQFRRSTPHGGCGPTVPCIAWWTSVRLYRLADAMSVGEIHTSAAGVFPAESRRPSVCRGLFDLHRPMLLAVRKIMQDRDNNKN